MYKKAVWFALFLSLVTTALAPFDTSRMDTSVNACDNFYQYVNGNWLKKTEIPAAFPSWGA